MAFGNPIERVYFVGTDTGEVWYGTEDFSTIPPLPSWEKTACSNSGKKVNKVAADPYDHRRAFAVFDGAAGRIRVCHRDGINSWSGETIDEAFTPEVFVGHVTSIVVDPSVKNTVYIGTDQGVYKGVQDVPSPKSGAEEPPIPLPIPSGGWRWSCSLGYRMYGSRIWQFMTVLMGRAASFGQAPMAGAYIREGGLLTSRRLQL